MPPSPPPPVPSGPSIELPIHTGAPFSDIDKSGTSSASLSGGQRSKRKQSNHMKAVRRANTQPLEGKEGASSASSLASPGAASEARSMTSPALDKGSGWPQTGPMTQTSSWPPSPHTGAAAIAPGDKGALGEPIADADAPQRRRTSLWAKPAAGEMTHRVPGSQYFILAVWMSLLFLLYVWSRFLCTVNIPDDCAEHDDIVIAMRDIQFLMYSGFVLAVMTGMHWPDRFQYVFAFGRDSQHRGPAFLVLLVLTALIWGLLNKIPAFSDFSLSSRVFSSVGNVFLLLVLSVFAGGLVIWHLLHAFRNNSSAGFVAYCGSRLLFACFYATYGILAANDDSVNFHFHHYMFGYLGALLAEFNHPVSLVLLAVGTSIYVQGIAAYEADTIIYHRESYLHFNFSGQELVSPLVTREAADFFVGHCREWNGAPEMNLLNLEH